MKFKMYIHKDIFQKHEMPKEEHIVDYDFVSLDMYNFVNTSCEKEESVHDVMLKETIRLLKENKDVIFNGYMFSSSRRKKIVDSLRKEFNDLYCECESVGGYKYLNFSEKSFGKYDEVSTMEGWDKVTVCGG